MKVAVIGADVHSKNVEMGQEIERLLLGIFQERGIGGKFEIELRRSSVQERGVTCILLELQVEQSEAGPLVEASVSSTIGKQLKDAFHQYVSERPMWFRDTYKVKVRIIVCNTVYDDTEVILPT